MSRLFGRTKTLLTKFLINSLFGKANILLTNHHMSTYRLVGKHPFFKVSQERRLFGRAKNLLTKYHRSADCLVGLRPF